MKFKSFSFSIIFCFRSSFAHHHHHHHQRPPHIYSLPFSPLMQFIKVKACGRHTHIALTQTKTISNVRSEIHRQYFSQNQQKPHTTSFSTPPSSSSSSLDGSLSRRSFLLLCVLFLDVCDFMLLLLLAYSLIDSGIFQNVHTVISPPHTDDIIKSTQITLHCTCKIVISVCVCAFSFYYHRTHIC